MELTKSSCWDLVLIFLSVFLCFQNGQEKFQVSLTSPDGNTVTVPYRVLTLYATDAEICSGSSTNMLLENNKEIHADDNARGQSHQDASIAMWPDFRHRLLAMQGNTQSASDIDARSDDPQMCGLYVSDIYEYLRELEVKPKQRPLHDYIERVQEDITASKRGVLVDWLVEVAEKYKLESETLYLTVSYIDRYLSLRTVNEKSLQLVGISAMLIASKYEEQKTRPKVEHFCYVTGDTYTKQQVLKMEEDILFALQFELGSPTINTFLRRFIRVAQEDLPNLQLKPLCCFLSELSILDYKTVKFVPSLLAASAVFLARFIICPKQHPWNHMLEEYTKYKTADLLVCVGIMHDLYLIRRGGSQQAVRKKYKHQKFQCVATIPVSPELPETLWEEFYHFI